MTYSFPILLIVLVLITACKQDQEVKESLSNDKITLENFTADLIKEESIDLEKWLKEICVRKKLSDSFMVNGIVDIEALRLIDQYYSIDDALLKEEHEFAERYDVHPILQGVEHDFDEDGVPEILCYLGKTSSIPAFLIFAYEKGKYVKKIQERIYLHNGYPNLYLFKEGNLVRNGSFYYRGSGHWLYVYEYYSKLGSQVRKVLECPRNTRDGMSFDLLNSSANLKYDTLLDQKKIRLVYSYESEGSYILSEKLDRTFKHKNPISIYNQPNLIINLEWNSYQQEYKSEIVEYLMNIENDTLQWKVIPQLHLEKLDVELYEFLSNQLQVK